MKLQTLLEDLFGPDLPIGIRAYDGTQIGPPDPPASLVINSEDALRRVVTRPGELGFARAYVCGDVDIEGDIFEFVNLNARLPQVKLTFKQVLTAIKILGWRNLRPLPPPPEEYRWRFGSRHSRNRDASSISEHYDLPNEFFKLILGPAMTYTCAVYDSEKDTHDQAQANKYELICRKLNLGPGKRLLDLGCGWGGMAHHAAKYHGANVVGVTISKGQVEYSRALMKKEGLEDRVEIRLQDIREVNDGPYDAVCAIGLFEHVGLNKKTAFFERIHSLLPQGGRLLNHAISRKPFIKERLSRSGFSDRYVFPDGELYEIGKVVSAIQQAGFDVRHVEGFREHYALTLRHWAENLERNWDQVVALSSDGRARVWRLYLAGAAMRFAWNQLSIHQVLGIKGGSGPDATGMPLRPTWEGPLTRSYGQSKG